MSEKNTNKNDKGFLKPMDKKTKTMAGILGGAAILLGGFIIANHQNVNETHTSHGAEQSSSIPFMDAMNGDTANLENSNTRLSSPIENPDVVKIAGKDYFLFDSDVLLPIDVQGWDAFNIPGEGDGSYEGIREFYIKGENQANWTQKFTVHKVKNSDGDAYALSDKIINGIIANISAAMTASNLEFKPDNVSFNYVRRDAKNTLFYWEKKAIPDTPDEVQFVRIFESPFRNSMYLVTYTLKTNAASLKKTDIEKYMTTLNSIQELKRKDAPEENNVPQNATEASTISSNNVGASEPIDATQGASVAEITQVEERP